jgi:hypothetical protein
MDILEGNTQDIDHQSMTGKPGRIWAISSPIFANVALAIAPGVFGPLESAKQKAPD